MTFLRCTCFSLAHHTLQTLAMLLCNTPNWTFMLCSGFPTAQSLQK